MRSAFVTGGYGLLGSALVKAPRDGKVEVTVLRRDATPRRALVLERLEEYLNVVSGDVTDGTVIERALGDYEVDSGSRTPGGEIDRQYIDTKKPRELTGWAPRVSLEDALSRLVEWNRAHPTALGR